MTQNISPETVEYGRYVEGLRKANCAMATAIRNLMDSGDGLIAAIDGSTDQFEPEAATFSAAVSAAEKTLPESPLHPDDPRIITVTVEGGLVQNVTGVPAGYELHVQDHDEGGTNHPSWEAEKQCFVTIFDGGET